MEARVPVCERSKPRGKQGTYPSVDPVTTATWLARIPFWALPLLCILTKNPAQGQNRYLSTQTTAVSMVTTPGLLPAELALEERVHFILTDGINEHEDNLAPTMPDRQDQQQRVAESQALNGELQTPEFQVGNGSMTHKNVRPTFSRQGSLFPSFSKLSSYKVSGTG